MAELDYFFESKIIGKNLKKLKGQMYRSVYPVTSKMKFRWSIDTNFVADRFCYDYLFAYKFDRLDDVNLNEDLKYLEIVSIAITNGRIEDKNINNLVAKLKRLSTGEYKAVSYDDKVLLNLLEVYDLISQRNFPLNQENFELFIHILFRNLVSDLDIVPSYMRDEKTKTSIKNPIDNRLIAIELENFWKVLEESKSESKLTYSGISKAFLLALEMYYISPYNQFNLIIMTFIAKWYLYQLDDEFRSFYFNFMIFLNYKEFIHIVEDALKNFNLDQYLELMRSYCQRELNFSKRVEWLLDYSHSNSKFRQLKKYENLFYIIFLMGFGDKSFSVNMVLKKNTKSSFKMTKETIEEKLALFQDLGILAKDPHKEMYFISEPEFRKYALMFKD